jgi:hypothetical protein
MSDLQEPICSNHHTNEWMCGACYDDGLAYIEQKEYEWWWQFGTFTPRPDPYAGELTKTINLTGGKHA